MSACGFVVLNLALGGGVGFWSVCVVEFFGVWDYMHMCVYLLEFWRPKSDGVCSPHGSLLGAGRRS